MKAFTEAEIRAEIIRQQLKNVWLENSGGSVLIPGNTPGVKLSSALDRIFRMLTSETLPEAVYYIKAKASQSSRSSPVVMPFIKGNVTLQEGTLKQIPASVYSPTEMNFQQILQLHADNATLKAENSALRQQLAKAENKIEMLEEVLEDLREENGELSEGVKNPGFTITPELVTASLPILSELFKKSEPKPAAVDPQLQEMRAGLLNMQQVLQQQGQQQKQLLELFLNQVQLQPVEEEEEEPTEMTEEDLLEKLQAQDPTGETVRAYLEEKQKILNNGNR